MINQLSLSQLEHKARIENNDLALIILEKMEEELEEAVENALTTNDADYSYEVFDAVQAVEFLIDCTWYRLDESRLTKGRIIHMIETLHEDTSCYNNQVKLWKYKGLKKHKN